MHLLEMHYAPFNGYLVNVFSRGLRVKKSHVSASDPRIIACKSFHPSLTEFVANRISYSLARIGRLTRSARAINYGRSTVSASASQPTVTGVSPAARAIAVSRQEVIAAVAR